MVKEEPSYCPECKKVTETRIEIPICDKNPTGKSEEGVEHGNVIDGTITCEDEYCNPGNIDVEEFVRLNGPDAKPDDFFVYCRACESAKGQYYGKPPPEEKKHPNTNVIIAIESYTGNDTWLEVSDGKMYAIVSVYDNGAHVDFGYRSKEEAVSAAKGCDPDTPVIIDGV